MFWHQAGAPPCDLLQIPAAKRIALGINCVSQERRIFSQLTVEENLHIARQAVEESEAMNSSDIYRLFPQLFVLRQAKGVALSEENQHQLALASALVTRPRLLILDEPTRGTGQAYIHKLGNLIVRLSRAWHHHYARGAEPAVHSSGRRLLLLVTSWPQRGSRANNTIQRPANQRLVDARDKTLRSI